MFVALALLAISSVTASAIERHSGIWKVMRDGGFGRMMNEDAHVIPIGDMTVGSKQYHFEHYEWLESKRNMTPGGFPHGATLLLVFERAKKGLIYLGSYENPEGGRPRIKGRSLIFPYKDIEILGWKMGKTVTFDEKGPPARIRLRDQSFSFDSAQ
jgi:hypothetical protein